MRDEREATEALGLVVLGVSYDSPEANRRFAEEEDFPFLLLTDADKSIARIYGAKRLLPLAKRISYVIDEEGHVLHAYDDVDPKTHLDKILADLK